MEARWSSVGLRSEKSGARFSLRSPYCSLEQDTSTSQKVLVIPRKQWLRPDMTKICCLGRKASTQTNKTSIPIVHRFKHTKRYKLLTICSKIYAFQAYFNGILAFVHRLPLAAFIDCIGIFEKAFSIALESIHSSFHTDAALFPYQLESIK